MGCRLCKILVGLVILAALIAAVSALLSLGAGAYPLWTSFVRLVAAKFGLTAGAALGYKLFSLLLGLGGALIYVLADYIDWILCLICRFLGKCEDCPEPHLNPH